MIRFQRRQRTTFTKRQLDTLQEAFEQNHYPDPQFRDNLARETNLDSSRIQVWFQNQRAKDKKRRVLSTKPIYHSVYPSIPHLNDSDANSWVIQQKTMRLGDFQSPNSASSSNNSEVKMKSSDYICLFSSSMANEAAEAVSEGKVRSMIEYHHKMFGDRQFNRANHRVAEQDFTERDIEQCI